MRKHLKTYGLTFAAVVVVFWPPGRRVYLCFDCAWIIGFDNKVPLLGRCSHVPARIPRLKRLACALALIDKLIFHFFEDLGMRHPKDVDAHVKRRNRAVRRLWKVRVLAPRFLAHVLRAMCQRFLHISCALRQSCGQRLAGLRHNVGSVLCLHAC